MKTIIIIAIILFCLLLSADEWIKVKDKDFKITKIDTLQCIVVTDGYYDIKFTEKDTIITYKGGLGQYFFYEDNDNNTKIILPKEMKKRLKRKQKLTILKYGKRIQ